MPSPQRPPGRGASRVTNVSVPKVTNVHESQKADSRKFSAKGPEKAPAAKKPAAGQPPASPSKTSRWKARAERCIGTGEGLHHAVAGKKASFVIKAQSIYNREITWGGELFEAVAIPAYQCEDGSFRPATSLKDTVEAGDFSTDGSMLSSLVITDNLDGTYTVDYTCDISGDYLLAVFLDGMNIMASPFDLEVQSAELFQGRISDDIQEPIVGDGNIHFHKSGLHRSIEYNRLLGKVVSAEHVIKVPHEEHHGFGTIGHYGSHHVTAAGDKTVFPIQGYDHLGNKRSTGAQGQFVTSVTRRDESVGNRVIVEGTKGAPSHSPHDPETDHKPKKYQPPKDSKPKGYIEAKDRPTCEVIDNGDGTYAVEFTSNQVAYYDVDITLVHSLHEELEHKPNFCPHLTVELIPNKVEAFCCTGVGPALTQIEAGIMSTFTIEARDAYGNLQRAGGEIWDVVIKKQVVTDDNEKEPVLAQIKDGKNGTYLVFYEVREAGKYTLSVLHDTPVPDALDEFGDKIPVADKPRHISMSPFLLTVVPHTLCAKSSTATGEHLYAAVAGAEHTFHVQPRDQCGNQRHVHMEEDELTVTIRGKDEDCLGTALVEHSHDGDYLVKFVATRAAFHFIHVEFRGQDPQFNYMQLYPDVTGSPFLCDVVPAPIDPFQCEIEEFGANAKLTAGKEYMVIMQAYDRFKNKRRSGGDKVTLDFRCGESGYQADVVDNDDGTYELYFTVTRAGVHEVTCCVDGIAIAKNPFLVQVLPDVTDGATSCIVPSSALLQPNLVAGEEVLFVLQAKDKFGNNRGVGGDVFHVELDSMREEEESAELIEMVRHKDSIAPFSKVPRLKERLWVEDVGDGTYVVGVRPALSRQDAIHATYNKVQLALGPYVVNVIPGAPDPLQSMSWGLGLNHAATSQQAFFFIQARDQCGNPLLWGGDMFDVVIRRKKHRHHAHVLNINDNCDGTYTVTYFPDVSGEYQVEVTLNHKECGESPYELIVK